MHTNLRTTQAPYSSPCFSQSSIYKWRAEYCREHSVIRSKNKKICSYLLSGQQPSITKQPSSTKSPRTLRPMRTTVRLPNEYSLPLIKMVSNADEAIRENKQKLAELQQMKDSFTKISSKIAAQRAITFKPKSIPNIALKKPQSISSPEKYLVKKPPLTFIRALFSERKTAMLPNSSFVTPNKNVRIVSKDIHNGLGEGVTRNKGIIGKYMSQLSADRDFMFLSEIATTGTSK